MTFSLFLVQIVFVVLAQIAPPTNLPPLNPNPNPNPNAPADSTNAPPGGSGGSTASRPSNSVGVSVMSKATFGDYLVSGTDALGAAGANGGFAAIHAVFGPPSWLLSRDRSTTVDQAQSAQMGDTMRWWMLGLVPLALAVTAITNAGSLMAGREVPPSVPFGGVLMVGLGAMLGFNYRFFAGAVVDLVGSLFAAIGGADLVHIIDKGSVIPDFGLPLIGPLLALVYIIVCAALTFVWWIQWVWVIVLSAALAIALLAAVTPFVQGFGRQVVKKWAGSLIDPFIMLLALAMAAPFIDPLDANNFSLQLASIGFMIVAWQAPGFFAGALGASVPWIAQAYMMSRLAGRARFLQGSWAADAAGVGPRAAATAGSGAGAASGSGGMPAPESPARWEPVPWGLARGQGGGSAIHNKLGPGPAGASA